MALARVRTSEGIAMSEEFKEINIDLAPVQHIECGQTAIFLSMLVGVGGKILFSDVHHIDGTRGTPNEEVRCGHCGDWLFTPVKTEDGRYIVRTRRLAEK